MNTEYWSQITGSLFGDVLPCYRATGQGALPSAFDVSGFAQSCIGAAGVALARLQGTGPETVLLDRRLCPLWFDMTVQPKGWDAPSIWDAVAGIYACKEGWIRLHTNAPHHRDAALGVLQVGVDREAVARAAAQWSGADLETAIVQAGGCAARLQSPGEWAGHAQGRAVAAEPLVAWQTQADITPREQDLNGLKVLDLTRVLAGPVATRFLAGFGADVLRIDPPFWNEPAAELEVTLGKRCAGLDLRKRADVTVLEGLIAQADVLVHGYRADALDRIGLGEKARRALNPGLIDVALNAYGWSGPWRDRRGFDSLVQMSCGIAARGMEVAQAKGPVPLPVQALDHGTGYLMAAAVLHALAERGQGRVLSARLSLARTAECLKAVETPMDDTGRVTMQEADLAPEIEHTTWGPAGRVRPPLQVDGVSPRWSRPAGHLRRDAAVW